jgi:hypothetical protein
MKKITTVDYFKISTNNWLLRFDLTNYFMQATYLEIKGNGEELTLFPLLCYVVASIFQNC